MSFSWDDMLFWSSGEWETAQEKLDDEEEAGYVVCPERTRLFEALDVVPYANVSVAILGQDPYPNLRHANGIAFSVCPRTKELPSSLRNIYSEYVHDLGYPHPHSGDLSRWCERGVLLWNVFPSCREGQPGSHHWPEWETLTEEILRRLDEKGNVVFAFLGRVAGSFRVCVEHSPCIETSHPSPLGARQGFIGSRLFSAINKELKKPIYWRL